MHFLTVRFLWRLRERIWVCYTMKVQQGQVNRASISCSETPQRALHPQVAYDSSFATGYRQRQAHMHIDHVRLAIQHGLACQKF